MTLTSSPDDRRKEPELLYNLGKSLSAELNLSDLLTKVTDAAVSLTDAAEGQILLQEPETGLTTIQALRNPEDFAAHSVSLPVSDLICLQVLESGQPVLVEADGSEKSSSSDLAPNRSAVVVPLVSKGRTIGVLAVRKKMGAGHFLPHDQEMLAGLAGYAAIAIENARLYSQALDRTFQLSLLVESANALSWSLDLGRVLNAVARHMMRSLEASWCTITSWSQETDTISRLAEHRLAIWPSASALEIPIITVPPLREAIDQGKIVTADSSEAWVSREGYVQVVMIPLQHQGRVVGVAQIARLATRRFPAADALRRSVPVALAFGPLLTQRDLPGWRNLLLEAARSLTSTSGADFCTIYVWNPLSKTLRRLLDYGSGVWLEQTGSVQDVAGLPICRVVLHEQRAAVIRSTDPRLTSAEKNYFESVGMGAQVLLPLVFKAKTLGLVQLHDPDPDREFSARDMGLAQALANQAAVALENAHLVRDLQNSLEQQRAMQGQLVRAARLSALGELTAVIAHQINNPLTTILGDAEMLVQDTPAGTALRESSEAIRRAGRRAKQVVERLLNMARAESEFKVLDVNETILEALALVETQIKNANIELQVRLSDGLPPVRAIPGQLEDVWMNLIVNARDAITLSSRNPRHITVSSELSDDQTSLNVLVEDTGVGILPEDLDRVFDPMFTTKPHGKGTGLGLYICRQIVTEHGGKIQISSKPGNGTCVTVQLPHKIPVTQEGSVWPTS